MWRVPTIETETIPKADPVIDQGARQPALQRVQSLTAQLKPYASPSNWRSVSQLSLTAGAFALLWFVMWLSLDLGYWLTLLLGIPAAGLLVRFFCIQHDCGHGSFFRSRLANDLVGRAIGVLTLTPYDYWRRAHAIHHATSGNLDRRGVGDVTTLTVREYRGLSWLRRFGYRFYRNPLVLFGLGPIYVFALKHRWPLDFPLFRQKLWFGVLATNVAIVVLTVVMAMLLGVTDVLKVQLPVTLLGSAMGVWLFFVQHQFEDAYWRNDADWNVHQAAIEGSSYYSLPGVLRWFTASIGLHHIHHLSSKVPNYRLKECLDQIPELRQAKRLTMLDSLKCVTLALWDEDTGKMVRFRDLKKIKASASNGGAG